MPATAKRPRKAPTREELQALYDLRQSRPGLSLWSIRQKLKPIRFDLRDPRTKDVWDGKTPDQALARYRAKDGVEPEQLASELNGSTTDADLARELAQWIRRAGGFNRALGIINTVQAVSEELNG